MVNTSDDMPERASSEIDEWSASLCEGFRQDEEGDFEAFLNNNASLRERATQSEEFLNALKNGRRDPMYWANEREIHQWKCQDILSQLEKLEIESEATDDEEELAKFDKAQKSLQKAVKKARYDATLAATQLLEISEECLRYGSETPCKEDLPRYIFAFLSLVINRLINQDRYRIGDQYHPKFKTDLCRFYNAAKPPERLMKHDKLNPWRYHTIWCPVMQEYFDYDKMKAVHIIPRFIGDITMNMIFGDGCDLSSVENGLLLHENIHTLLVEGQIAIMPLVSEGRSELVIRVLERGEGFLKSKLWNSNISNGDLQNRMLVFKGPNRPKKIYFCLMYLIALHKCAAEDRDEGRRAESTRPPKIFAALTYSLRKSMIPAFAAHFGQDIAPLSKKDKASAEYELEHLDPYKLTSIFQKGLTEITNDIW